MSPNGGHSHCSAGCEKAQAELRCVKCGAPWVGCTPDVCDLGEAANSSEGLVEKEARGIAARKMMLVNDPLGEYLPDDLWRQCEAEARRTMALAELSPSPAQWPEDMVERMRAAFYPVFMASLRIGNDEVEFEIVPALRAALAAVAPPEDERPTKMNDAQIKHMADRFLWWRLPDNFSPDCGIHFDADEARKLNPRNGRYEPVGTNLFSATQAEAMVRHMIEGVHAAPPEDAIGAAERAVGQWVYRDYPG